MQGVSDLDTADLARAFDSAGRVDRVTPHIVDELASADSIAAISIALGRMAPPW